VKDPKWNSGQTTLVFCSSTAIQLQLLKMRTSESGEHSASHLRFLAM